jgi:DNA-binding CsgD family transcriptional regulator
MLTVRETEVLRLLSRGSSYAGVAERLSISAHTVGTHVKNAYRKLDVHCATAAVMRAAELGLLAVKLPSDGGDARRDVGAHVNADRVFRGLERGELALEERSGHVPVPPVLQS